MTKEGVLVIKAQRYRSQERNREDARARLFELIRRAAEVPAFRRPTRPTLASKERRLRAKDRRSGLKRLRRSEEHTSELQSLMRISYAVFCLKKKIHTAT